MTHPTASRDAITDEPKLAGTDVAVAEVVRVAYDRDIDAAVALGASREAVLDALDFCAERRCEATEGRCRGCVLWTRKAGLASLDEFCRRFAPVAFADGGLTVSHTSNAAPAPPLPVPLPPTLEELARVWAGEEIWYLARRVLRRLKHKSERDGKLKPDAAPPGPAIVLVGAQMADNIGMAARAMANFGLDDLRLVAPRDGWPNDKARFAASGAHGIIDTAEAFPETPAAIADLEWVCATSARPRNLAKLVLTPDQAIAEMARRTARGERCGILFGPERTGLSSDDVARADALVMVRVAPTFASINLAQTVLLMGYEWLKQTGHGAIGRHTAYEGVAATGLVTGSPPATKGELDALLSHLAEELDRAGHFQSPEKRQIMLRNLRSTFERLGASRQEVRTLRGVIVSLSRGRHTTGRG